VHYKIKKIDDKELTALSKIIHQNSANTIGSKIMYLSHQKVQVGVGGSLNVQRATADVVHCLIVKHHCNISVLQEGVGGQDGVVGLNDSSGDLGGGVDGEAELGLLAVVHRQALQQQRAQARAGTTTHSVEDQEALEAGTVVCQLSDAVQCQVNNLLANCNQQKKCSVGIQITDIPWKTGRQVSK
jgi:hypothetical protein